MRKTILAAAALLGMTAAAQAHSAAIVPTVIVGAHANQDGACMSVQTPMECETDFNNLQDSAGVFITLDSQYAHRSDFSSATGLPEAQNAISNGHVPMLTFFLGNPPGDCPLWSSVVAGGLDDELTDETLAFKALGANIIVRMDPAMDTAQRQCFYDVDVLADPVDAGQEFIAMWKHIVDLFRAQGVTNVRWDWSPSQAAYNNPDDSPDTRWADFYPGDDYVDWIGAQVYNGDTVKEPIQTYPGFLNFYNQAVVKGKPLILSETGALGPDPQDPCSSSVGTGTSPQSKWLYTMSTNFRVSFPAMKAIVYFDVPGSPGPDCKNYLLRGDGLVSFSNLLAKPYFQDATLP
jgi:hypothetical protein